MPYRIKAGQEVYIEYEGKPPIAKTLNRSVDFTKKELRYSPLTEHEKEGYYPSRYFNEKPWGFNIQGKWDDGGNASILYASEVHYIDEKTSKDTKTVVVPGSGTNQYTLTLNDEGRPIKCSCPGFRYHRGKTVWGKTECKHIRAYKWDNNTPF